MTQFQYPCTGKVGHDGFGNYLDNNLGEPRQNICLFTQELGNLVGAKHLSLTNSGSSANLAAALALAEKTGPGVHAIVAGFTFPTTVSALQTAGFEITVVDTVPSGFCISPTAALKAMRTNTKVLCITHFLGFPAPMEELFKMAEDYGLMILQDACETLDLRISDKPIHSWGTLTTLSFYHPHHLSSYGGGAVISINQNLFRSVESIIHWGRECTCHFDSGICQAPPGMDHNFWYVRYGYNLEMSELNACFGRFQLQTWTQQEAARKHNYDQLYDILADCTSLKVYPRNEVATSPFVFPVTCLKEPMPTLVERLMKRGIEARSLMGGAIIKQPAYSQIPHDGLFNCLKVGQSSFFVGAHQTLKHEDVIAQVSILDQ
jgi:CDP-6-deoxy-D-xylo-4-hexulose-3-dehydrase